VEKAGGKNLNAAIMLLNVRGAICISKKKKRGG